LPAKYSVLALYTTIYPGVERYVAEWYRSVCVQTDKEFQLWIGLDQLNRDFVRGLLGADVEANWVEAPCGATPAQIRQLALAQIVDNSSEVVLVDSDDLLHPARVAAARSALQSSELAGCALQLVDQQGTDLESTFNLPPHLQPEDVLPRNNVFGFSNSAFRAELLRRTLPIPANAVLVDWFIATRAWLLGAKLGFDREPRMDYRQHPRNMALVRPPFSPDQVRHATALVCQHFRLLLAQPRRDFDSDRYTELKKVAAQVEEFSQRVIPNSASLANYVNAFNALEAPQIWWSCVAHPALSHLWGK
jgi:hypothetical protein